MGFWQQPVNTPACPMPGTPRSFLAHSMTTRKTTLTVSNGIVVARSNDGSRFDLRQSRNGKQLLHPSRDQGSIFKSLFKSLLTSWFTSLLG
jgi:hypothetical protein